jgi:hypothetical protein
MQRLVFVVCGLLPAGWAAPSSGGEPVFEEISMGTPKGNYAAVAMGDVDRDGRAEVLSGRRDKQEGLYLFTWKESRWARLRLNADGEYGGVALADVTGDKVLDILAVRTAGSPSGLVLYRSVLRDGKLRVASLPSPYSETGCDDVTVGDIESDGDMDIAVSAGGKGLKVLLNSGDATSFRTLTLQTGTYEDTALAFGDPNGDGRLDVIAGNHPGENPRLFLCSPSGEVAYDKGHVEGLEAPGIGFKPAFTDVDGDSIPDLVMATQQGVRVFGGNGCKGPDAKWWRPLEPFDRVEGTMMVCAGDIDRDGKDDLAVSSGEGIVVLLRRGPGTYSSRITAGLPTRGEYSGCCLFDWDGDGDLDLACSSLQGAGVRFFKNRLVE